MLNVNEKFPGFCLNGVNSANQLVQVKSDDLAGSWAVIYFYPKDFTFICPTEIAAMDKLNEDWSDYSINKLKFSLRNIIETVIMDFIDVTNISSLWDKSDLNFENVLDKFKSKVSV